MHVVVCIPGVLFSGQFLESWTNLINHFNSRGIKYTISRGESPNIYEARNICLGGNYFLGENQKPFDGKIDYTHILWIDSDMVFKPTHFDALLNDNLDVVSGLYKTADGVHFAAVRDCNMDFFEKNGHFEFLTTQHLNGNLIEVAYTGMGFMLVKRGVFEKLTFPWFRPMNLKFKNINSFSTEDVSLCGLLQNSGYKIVVDTRVRLGHQKYTILY